VCLVGSRAWLTLVAGGSLQVWGWLVVGGEELRFGRDGGALGLGRGGDAEGEGVGFGR